MPKFGKSSMTLINFGSYRFELRKFAWSQEYGKKLAKSANPQAVSTA